MGWFWKSKKPQEPQVEEIQIEEIAGPTIEETLQAEIDRLKEQNAESFRLQTEWQESADNASRERDASRAEAAEATAELNRRLGELQSSHAATQERLNLLDEANVSMANMVKERDQQIDELQNSSASGQQRVAELETQLTSHSQTSTARIAELTEQLEATRQQASSKAIELEQRAQAEAAEAAKQIATLEQQLKESEARSASRAEQRSALLRNMAEIHRLSTTSAKSDPPAEALKLVKPAWTGAKTESTAAKNGAWNEQSESESA